jgi:hypothetical protein
MTIVGGDDRERLPRCARNDTRKFAWAKSLPYKTANGSSCGPENHWLHEKPTYKRDMHPGYKVVTKKACIGMANTV